MEAYFIEHISLGWGGEPFAALTERAGETQHTTLHAVMAFISLLNHNSSCDCFYCVSRGLFSVCHQRHFFLFVPSLYRFIPFLGQSHTLWIQVTAPGKLGYRTNFPHSGLTQQFSAKLVINLLTFHFWGMLQCILME